jgi:hypothetical protein
MPRRRRLRATTVLLCALLATTLAPAAAQARRHAAAASDAGERVWVASASSSPVYGYAAESTGRVAAVSEADPPSDPNVVWDPWGVALDGSGDLFVQSFLSDATTFVFPPGAGRGVAPSREFVLEGPDSRAIAVDPAGYEYVQSSEGCCSIDVGVPGAAGQASNLYFVNPVRQFDDDSDQYDPWPDILSIDGSGNLLVSVARSSGNAIETYLGGPSGSGTPLSMLSGARTGLGACTGFSTCRQVSIDFSTATGELYAAVSGNGLFSHISVFAGGAEGNAAPLRTISGFATGLVGRLITGIAVSPATGDIYVMVRTAEFGGTGRIEVFGASASGDVAPVRTFTSSEPGAFSAAEGIAIGPAATTATAAR